MRGVHRCFVVVPFENSELYNRLVSAFRHDPAVFVMRDRRSGERAVGAVGVYAVGGGPLDPVLRRAVEDTLRAFGAL